MGVGLGVALLFGVSGFTASGARGLKDLALGISQLCYCYLRTNVGLDPEHMRTLEKIGSGVDPNRIYGACDNMQRNLQALNPRP